MYFALIRWVWHQVLLVFGLGLLLRGTLDLAPSQDAIVTTRIITFSVGNPYNKPPFITGILTGGPPIYQEKFSPEDPKIAIFRFYKVGPGARYKWGEIAPINK